MKDKLKQVQKTIVESDAWKSIFRHGYADTPRNRILMVASNVFLHLHPSKLRRHGLTLRFTWCAGGLTFFFFLVTVVTGVLVMFYSRPAAQRCIFRVTIPKGTSN